MQRIRALALSIIVPLATAAFAASAQAALDVEKSTLSATFKQMNVPVNGQFRKLTANVHFDPANLATSKARFDVDVASFDLGSAEYDSQVAGKDWFDAKDFPRASFVSTAIQQGANGSYAVTGTLTIRGRSATVVVPMQYRKDGAAQVFDGVLPIKRLQYGIGQGEWADTSLVADDVQLKFHIVYNGQ
ncbi:YceI family protein [Caballeronia sp. GAFFF1]|uniref:YceI family protein n=1 Tax=Caballeronia sp. GAFFF1 TaxID=2921779 RepID=UPI0020290FDB|nr:YceI family protein [Caballeronia sp. GAFFF1]